MHPENFDFSVDCNPVTPENGELSCMSANNVTTCNVTCYAGFHLQGPSEIIYDNQVGAWRGGEAVCTSKFAKATIK